MIKKKALTYIHRYVCGKNSNLKNVEMSVEITFT